MLYAKEHLDCRNYDSSERPAIEVKKMGRNTDFRLYSTQNKLFFLMEGLVEVETDMNRKKQIAKGGFRFASTGQNLKIHATEKALLLIIGITPREWFRKQREFAVYNDLMASEMSIKHIADKWGFASRQSLSNYCKRIYRQSPRQIYSIRSRKQTIATPMA